MHKCRCGGTLFTGLGSLITTETGHLTFIPVDVYECVCCRNRYVVDLEHRNSWLELGTGRSDLTIRTYVDTAKETHLKEANPCRKSC